MPRGVLVVCGLMMLLLAFVWWSMQGQPIAPPSPSSSPSKALAAAASIAATIAVDAPSERSEVVPVDVHPIPDHANWAEILVVDKTSDAPVAGADVVYYDDSCMAQVNALDAESKALLGGQGIAHRFGWHTRSGADGKVRVHFAKSYAMAYGSEGDRFGSVMCSTEVPPGGYRLQLEPDATLRVQVLDAASKPAADVPVAIRTTTQQVSVDSLMQSATVQDGIATFRHLQWCRARAAEVKGQTMACIATPGIDDDGVAFDLAAPPIAPIVLHLPPTGELAVRITSQGVPLPQQPTIGVQCSELGDQAKLRPALRRDVAADGWVHFPHLPLGRTFAVSCDLRLLSLRESIAGPVAAGECAHAELTVGDDVVILTGRLLDSTGAACVGRKMRMDLQTSRGDGSGAVDCDAEGRFVVFLRGSDSEAMQLQRLAFTDSAAGHLQARVGPRPMQLGRNDLGDVRLTTMPLVVGGRFLAERAIRANDLRFDVLTYDERRSRPDHPEWQRVYQLAQEVQEDGRFEVRGTVPAGRYRLEFPSTAHLPVAPIEFVPGTDNLQIPISFGSRLTASCLLPEGIAGRQLRAVLRPSAALSNESRAPGFLDSNRFVAEPADAGKRAQIVWPALPPDSYTFELYASGIHEPFVRIAGVQVPTPAGGDPRLVDIDLRTAMRLVLVRVTWPPDAEVDSHRVVVFPMPQPGNDRAGYPVLAGELRMPAPPGPIDLLVACPGLQPKFVRGVDREVTVVLEPWAQVELRFPALPALPEGFEFHVVSGNATARPEGICETCNQRGPIDRLLQPEVRREVVRDGMARMTCGVGASRIRLWLSDAATSTSVPLDSITPNEVPEGAATLTVRVSADEVAAAIDKLREMPKHRR